MKKFLKILGGIIFIPYILIVIVVTICLLNYNKYGVTELGNYTLVIVEDAALNPTNQKGDLLVVEKKDNDSILKDDYIFFYEQDKESKTVIINLAKVLNTRKVTEKERTFTIEGNYEYSSEYVIGAMKDAKVYHTIGGILGILESRWVFLLFIILPILFIFLYELYEFILEVKRSLKEV